MSTANRALCIGVLLLGAHSWALADKAVATVTAGDPYVRLVPAGTGQTSAYVLLRNGDNSAHALVKAASPAARIVELHTVVDEGGVKKMRPVPKMDIQAGSETHLKPGGLHIMLIDLKEPLKEGAEVPITLTFEDESEIALKAPVRPVVMPAKPAH